MSSGQQPLSILLLADVPRGTANTIRDHVGAFPRYSRHRVTIFNPRGLRDVPSLDLDAYDVVVIHYTIHPNIRSHVAPPLRERLRSFRGLKMQFLQDEYRWVEQMTAEMRDLGIDILFSAVPEGQVGRVYGGRLDRTKVLPTLTGYVPETLARASRRSLERRPVEVGYRGRVVPWWLGALGQEKVDIARGVVERAARHGLVCDIAWNEHDRLYGRRWSRFLARCRSTLLTESGASIVDFDGSIETRTQEYLDEYPSATFAEVHDAVLAPYEGKATINTVSPRAFEAAALRSALVAFPGDYSGLLEPGEHYIPLEKDFSNFDDVVDRIRDISALQAMTERAYDDLIRSDRYSYETFVHGFDDVVAEHATSGRNGTRAPTNRGVAVGLTTSTLRERRVQSKLAWRQARLAVRRTLATMRLVTTDRDLQRLVTWYLREGRPRSGVRLSRLARDLLWIGVIRRAHRGAAGTQRFSIEVTLDTPSERLILTSRRGAKPSSPARTEVLHRAIADGRILEIIWNHRAVGTTCLYVSALRLRPIRIPVGYYGLHGIHEFGALTAIAARYPEIVWRVLLPLTAPAPRWRRSPFESAFLRILPSPLLRVALLWLGNRRKRMGARRVPRRRLVRRLVRKRGHRIVRRLRRIPGVSRRRLRRLRKVLRGGLRRASWALAHLWRRVRS